MAKFTRNYMLPIGAALLVVGLFLTVVSWSWTYDLGDAQAGWLASYEPIAQYNDNRDGDWNLIVMIVGPIVLLTGAWYTGEQVYLRRKFERLIETPKKGEFLANKRDLEKLARRLPEAYKARIAEKESEFSARRAA